MTVPRALRRGLRAAAAPLFFLSLVLYFGWNASTGDRGLMVQARLRAALRIAEADAGRAATEARRWQRRVDSLSGAHLDPDALDEQARRMLNLANPADLVVPYRTAKPIHRSAGHRSAGH